MATKYFYFYFLIPIFTKQRVSRFLHPENIQGLANGQEQLTVIGLCFEMSTVKVHQSEVYSSIFPKALKTRL